MASVVKNLFGKLIEIFLPAEDTWGEAPLVRRGVAGKNPPDFPRLVEALMQDIKKQTLRIRDQIFAPNVFTIRLHPEDLSQMGDLQDQMVAGLQAELTEYYKNEGFSSLTPIRIQFERDPKLSQGHIIATGKIEKAASQVVDKDTAAALTTHETIRRDDYPTIVRPRLPKAVLLVVKGSQQGTSFPLVKLNSQLGREIPGHTLEIPLQDPSSEVSRRHASVTMQPDGTFLVMDSTSTYGTKLNGKALDPEKPVPFKPGDRIVLAEQIELELKVGEK